MADKQFQAHLIQHEWVTTEVFNITASDEKAAKAEAEKIIKTKDLEGREYKVEIVPADFAEDGQTVVAAEEAPASEPTEPEER